MSCDEAEYKRQQGLIRAEPEPEPTEMPADVKKAGKTLMAALRQLSPDSSLENGPVRREPSPTETSTNK